MMKTTSISQSASTGSKDAMTNAVRTCWQRGGE